MRSRASLDAFLVQIAGCLIKKGLSTNLLFQENMDLSVPMWQKSGYLDGNDKLIVKRTCKKQKRKEI